MSIRIGIGLGLIPTAARPAATTAPVNVVKPFFEGPLTQGQSADVNPGSWTGLPSPNFTYAIKRGATTVSTDPAYVWTAADVAAGAGAMTVAVTATNDIGPATATSDPVSIAAPLTLSGTPPTAMVGSPYSFAPTRTGGHGPFAFELTGSLPAGLSFAPSTGAISGTPITSGAASLSIDVIDADGLTANLGPFSLEVTSTPEYAPIDSAAKLSVDLGFRNGDASSGERSLVGPTLSNVFGSGNNAATLGSRAAGALGIRLRFQPSGMNTIASSSTMTQPIPVFGSGQITTSRAQTLYYYPEGAAAGSAGFRNRFVWFVASGNNVKAGDRDPATGAAGSASGSRGLRSPSLAMDDTGVWRGVSAIRSGVSGPFEAITVTDGEVSIGDAFDPDNGVPGTFLGNATPTNPTRLGSHGINPAGFGAFFSGALCDFIQLDGTAGSDAEWARFELGEDPVTIWGENVAAYYRIGGSDDLAKTAGSRGYGALTATGSGFVEGTMLRPARSSVAASTGLAAISTWRGYTHAVDSADVKPILGLPPAERIAALRGLSGSVCMDVLVIGVATHIEARAVRYGDDMVVRDWTRVTTEPATGRVATVLPNVPQGEHRIEYRREDYPDCVFIVRDSQRVGVTAAIFGQSQQDIACNDATSITLTPPASGIVSYVTMRGRGAVWNPVDGGILAAKNQMSDAMVAAALYWDSLGSGVPLELVAMGHQGVSTTQYLAHFNGDGLDLMGDGAAPSSGFLTSLLLAKRKRISLFLNSHCTADQSTALGGASQPFSTIYGTRTPTERPWTERANELFGGVAKVGAAAPEIAERSNFAKLGAVFRPLVVMMPRSRYRDIASTTAADASAGTAFRKIQFDYAESGAGRAAAVDAVFGAYQTDTLLGPTDSEHQDRTDPMGNITFMLRQLQALVADHRSGLGVPTGKGTSVIHWPVNLLNGGTLDTIVPGTAPQEFEVRESGGAWLKSAAGANFTASVVGGEVQITKVSGAWAEALEVRYNWGYPIAVGSTSKAAENALAKGMLIEAVDGMAPPEVLAMNSTAMGQAMRSYVPIAPSLVAVPVT